MAKQQRGKAFPVMLRADIRMADQSSVIYSFSVILEGLEPAASYRAADNEGTILQPNASSLTKF